MTTSPHTISLADAGVSFNCTGTESVLAAMSRQLSFGAFGGKRIPVGCRQGGCGVCRVQVLSGHYRMGPISRTHVSEADQRDGYALACRLIPEGDLVVRIATRIVPRPGD